VQDDGTPLGALVGEKPLIQVFAGVDARPRIMPQVFVNSKPDGVAAGPFEGIRHLVYPIERSLGWSGRFSSARGGVLLDNRAGIGFPSRKRVCTCISKTGSCGPIIVEDFDGIAGIPKGSFLGWHMDLALSADHARSVDKHLHAVAATGFSFDQPVANRRALLRGDSDELFRRGPRYRFGDLVR
jgi:hypothetical protein